MATLKKYDLTGKSKGDVEFDDALVKPQANSQMVKDYLVTLRANQRQWSASTQTRAEVSHTKRKPYAQKGTGNARQGFLGSPQFRGGGRVHAPRPKFDQNTQLNRKEKRLAVRYLFGQKLSSESAHVLEYSSLKNPSTKTLANFLNALKLNGKRVLVLAELGEENVYQTLQKSLRNIPKVQFNFVPNVNGQDLALCTDLVILESALGELKETFGGSK